MLKILDTVLQQIEVVDFNELANIEKGKKVPRIMGGH